LLDRIRAWLSDRKHGNFLTAPDAPIEQTSVAFDIRITHDIPPRSEASTS
jgi:hypothetical protein